MLNKKIGLLIIISLVVSLLGTMAPQAKAFTVFPTSAACTAAGGVVGDINHDGRINQLDKDAIRKIMRIEIPVYVCADLDQDGYISPSDSAFISELISDVAATPPNVIVPETELYETSFYNPYRTPACQEVMGDVNGDGFANSLDEDIINWMMLGKLPISPCADSDSDGYISPADYSISSGISKGDSYPYLEKPVITINGSNPVTLEVHTPYADAGATAKDTQDGDPIGPVLMDTSAINNALVGTYHVIFNITDSDGNTAVPRQRQVNVVDTTAPVITLIGANPLAIARGTAYTELGANVTDNYDASTTVAAANINASAVNTGVAGVYTVTYNHTDANGNVAAQVTRTVNVLSTSTGGGGGYGDITPPYNLSLKINNGDEITNNQSVNLTISATDAAYMMISNDSDFSGADWETYVAVKTWQLPSAFTRKTVYAKFKDSNGNISEAISASITLVPPQVPVDGVILDEDGEVLGEKYVDEREQQLAEIFDDAHYIWSGDTNLLLGYMNTQRNLALEQSMSSKYGSILGSNVMLAVGGIDTFNAIAVTNFLAYGTKTTLKLGAGERAGVLNSYKAAFGNLPKTEEDWRDAIKIGNGRWPSQKSVEAEKRANINFELVYKRVADMANANDNAAVTTMAYGLRPLPRNLNSEAAAIKIFKGVFGYYPVKATAWDVVRAIAYSGAKR